MAAFNKLNQFVEDLAKKVHNLNSDALFVALSNTAPSASNAILSSITEIAAGNGYTAGGNAAAFVSGAQTSGTYKLVLATVTFTASGGSIGPFRYAYLYNSTPTSPLKPLIGYFDYGAALTITNGNSFLVSLDQTNGVFTLV
jgi:hypothetical protein